MDEPQAEVFAFLARPENWPDLPATTAQGHASCVDIIETHGARVFLAGDQALKVKRAVRLPYLDFSTLAARKYFCDRELALNRTTASGLYRDVVPITRESSGHLAIAGGGTPVEWAVRMHRFSQNDLLIDVAAKGGLTLSMVESLADTIYSYHVAAPVAPALKDNIATICANVAASLRQKIPDTSAAELAALFERALDNPLRSKRAAAGYVRRCHGDLHLGNIVLWHGQPLPFDALEFDEDLATTDTLYDLAFLLMDLDRLGCRDMANAILNRYLWRSRDLIDIEGLALLPLFLGLRAAIRAMVTLDRAGADGPLREALHTQAMTFVDVAMRDLRGADASSATRPQLIAIGGLSGTGKTTLARRLAPRVGATPGALHLRTDMERKALAGLEPTVRLPTSAYTKSSSEAVYASVLERARLALEARHSVVLDAVFADPDERAAAEALATSASVAFTGYWLEGAAPTLAQRISVRTGDASDATVDVLTRQLAYDVGAITWHRIDALASPSDILANVQALLLPRA